MKLTTIHKTVFLFWLVIFSSLDVKSELLMTLIAERSGIASMVFSPDGKTIAVAVNPRSGTMTGVVRSIDITTKEEIFSLEGKGFPRVTGISYSPKGRKIAASYGDGRSRLWDVTTKTVIKIFEGHTKYVEAIAYSPDGTRIATASEDRTTKIWDANTGQELLTIPITVGKAIDFSPDGKILAIAGIGVILVDAISGKVIRTLSSGNKYAVAFSPDGTQIAAGAELYDVATGRKLLTLNAHKSVVTSVDFSPDGTTLATAGSDNRSNDDEPKLWNMDSKSWSSFMHPILNFKGQIGRDFSVVFSPDGRMIATARGNAGSSTRDTTPKLWLWDTSPLVIGVPANETTSEKVEIS